VEATFGKKRLPVVATFDGIPYRGTAVRMGGPQHILVVLKAIREQLGKGPGDTVKVTLEEDTAPREVEVPADFRQALGAHPASAAFFDGLAYSHRREYVRWIEDAKREETRRSRIEKAIGMLADGKKER